MIPLDMFLVFEGWNESHSPKKAGSDAMTAEQYKALVAEVDKNGNVRRS